MRKPETKEEAIEQIKEIIKNHPELPKGGWPVVWYPPENEKPKTKVTDGWSYYLKVELPENYTEEDVDNAKSLVEGCIGEWLHDPNDKTPIVVKKVSYTTNNK
jgi:hypothetical protein